LDGVKWFKVSKPVTDVEGRNRKIKEASPSVASKNDSPEDFSNGPQPFHVIPTDDRLYREFLNRIDDKAMMSNIENKNFYEIKLTNAGGLIMPVIIEWKYKDGTKEVEKLPAEIWRTDETVFTKIFVKEKEVASVIIDPKKETADINPADNVFPRVDSPSKFDEFKKKTN
jgi:hypothetical protein